MTRVEVILGVMTLKTLSGYFSAHGRHSSPSAERIASNFQGTIVPVGAFGDSSSLITCNCAFFARLDGPGIFRAMPWQPEPPTYRLRSSAQAAGPRQH